MRPERAALREAEGVIGDAHVRKGMSAVQGDAAVACVADHDKDGLAPTSEIHDEGITLLKRRRVTGIRRLFVPASIVVKAVLPCLYTASHDRKGAQQQWTVCGMR